MDGVYYFHLSPLQSPTSHPLPLPSNTVFLCNLRCIIPSFLYQECCLWANNQLFWWSILIVMQEKRLDWAVKLLYQCSKGTHTTLLQRCTLHDEHDVCCMLVKVEVFVISKGWKRERDGDKKGRKRGKKGRVKNKLAGEFGWVKLEVWLVKREREDTSNKWETWRLFYSQFHTNC